MANINSLMGTSSTSSTSSIYGNRNILTGLASGLDTESMIENSIQGYKLKIQNLIGQQTKLSWKQDAMRGLSDKMIALSQKYMSYTSKTNLASPSYFQKAVTTTTGGKNADLVSATGRSTSDVQINAVKQLASAARYSTSAEHLNVGQAVGASMSLEGRTNVGRLSGSMEITVGSQKVSLSFSEADVYRSAQEMVNGINEKLKASGDDKLVTARLSGNSISFSAGSASQSGDSVWISSASSSLESALGFTSGALGTGDKSITVPSANALYENKSTASYLSGKSINVTLDGETKSIRLGTLDPSSGTSLKDQLVSNLNSSLRSAFGEDKVTVELTDSGVLKFNASGDSNVKVASDSEQVGRALGLGDKGVSNYLDTNKTLGDLLGRNMGGLAANGDGTYSMTINGVTFGSFTRDTSIGDVLSAISESDAGVKASYSKLTGKFTFEAAVTGAGGRIEFSDGLATKLFGGTELRTGTLEDGSSNGVLTDEDGNAIAAGTRNGVAYYLKKDTDGEFYLASEDGRFIRNGMQKIRADLNERGVKDALTNARKGFSAGKDAIFNVKVNGEDMTLTRSSNTVELDGLSTTLKGLFNQDSISDTKDANGRYLFDRTKVAADTVVTFATKASDELVTTIKEFVDEYNTLLKDVRSAYTTQPLNKNSSANKYKTYEPLTDDEKEGMSEKQIEAYEEKAKTGLLFGDSDLRRAYDSLRGAITAFDLDRKAMESVGLSVTYENNVPMLKLDEDKLRAAMDSDPDRVEKVFTQSKATGSSSDGLIARVKNVMTTYASTDTGRYGALVQKAGSKFSALSLLNNAWQKQIDSLDTQIDRWQTKMSDKIDYYTRQFTALEKMMDQFNSQSSALAGLMGY